MLTVTHPLTGKSNLITRAKLNGRSRPKVVSGFDGVVHPMPIPWGPFQIDAIGPFGYLGATCYIGFALIWMLSPAFLSVDLVSVKHAGPIIAAVILSALIDWMVSENLTPDASCYVHIRFRLTLQSAHRGLLEHQCEIVPACTDYRCSSHPIKTSDSGSDRNGTAWHPVGQPRKGMVKI